jgi:hypothetical protein
MATAAPHQPPRAADNKVCRQSNVSELLMTEKFNSYVTTASQATPSCRPLFREDRIARFPAVLPCSGSRLVRAKRVDPHYIGRCHPD